MPVAQADSRHVTLSGPSLAWWRPSPSAGLGYISDSSAAVPRAFSLSPSSQHTRTHPFAVGYPLVADSRVHRYESPPPRSELCHCANMASNARYSQAPQRDSMDAQIYPHAPPSYQDAAGPSAGIYGTQRTEDDNVPDDFKVCLILKI